MLHNVDNANWVKQRLIQGRLSVMSVILVDSVAAMVFVQHAQLDFIKPQKVKQGVSNVCWEKRMWMQNHRVLIVILEHLAAVTGIAQLAQLDFIKPQKAKQNVLNVSKENCLKTSKLLAAGVI